jgi:integrase/predicted DNA-binding transcriptional regulator AlpA
MSMDASNGGGRGGGIASAPGGDALDRAKEEFDLPPVLNVRELAQFLRISEKALRHRIARGHLPRPFRCGKALAWTRDVVITWLWECGRTPGPTMKITTRPYHNDSTRIHVDIRFMNPCNQTSEIRRRLVAPPGLDDKQARSWGERQIPAILRELVAVNSGPVDLNASKEKTPSARAPRLTLAEFYEQRFLPEYVQLQKPATRVGYDSVYRNHLAPLLGDLPLSAIDADRISSFRAALRKRVGASMANCVLAKLAKLLGFAKKLGMLATVPDIEKLPQPKDKKKIVFTDAEIARLTATASDHGTEALIVCLLALDAGLRVSEICALEWADIDLAAGTIIVQCNTYRGEKQSPKGTIGTIGLTRALRAALVKHRKREPIGALVLYRRSHRTGGAWKPHTPHSIRHRLNTLQSEAGLIESGPHLLRHTALTRLANLGASIYQIQAVARHARLETTQKYLHTQQSKLTSEAAVLVDAAANGHVGKALAKRAKPRRK